MISKKERAKRTYRLLKPMRDAEISWVKITEEMESRKKVDMQRPHDEREFSWITAWSKRSLIHQYEKGEKLIEEESPKPIGRRIFETKGRGGLQRTILEYDTLENATMAAIMDAKEGD